MLSLIHIYGIRYLLEHPESGIRVGGLMMPEAGKDEIYGKMAELAKKRDIPVFYAKKGDIWNNFPGKGMSMECPVSYTHLDVYKRQDVIYKDMEDEVEKDLLKNAVSRLSPRERKIVEPVSYTHLSVWEFVSWR